MHTVGYAGSQFSPPPPPEPPSPGGYRGETGASTPPAQQLAVPPGDRVRVHQEARPSLPGQQAARRGQERSIGGGKAGSYPAPVEDLQLMAQHGDLEVAVIDAKAGEHAEQAAQKPIQHG